jgi:hypothetical protein
MTERTKEDQPIGHIRPKAGHSITDPRNPYYHLMKGAYGPPQNSSGD